MRTTAQQDSPAIQLLTVLWRHRQEETGHSWLRLNQSMRSGLMLAVEMGLRFNPNDLSVCINEFRADYWFGENLEDFYKRAVLYGNASAWKCYEAYMGRKPFIWKDATYQYSPFSGGKMGGRLSRLIEGAVFQWCGEQVTVTSFQDRADPKAFIACSYSRTASEDCPTCRNKVKYSEQKILHRYTITHQMLKDAKKAAKAKAVAA